MSVPWAQDYANPFNRGYKKCKRRPGIQRKADAAIRALVNAQNPVALSDSKRGELEGTFSWDLSGDCRILFECDEENHVIKFLRICSHKEVYGED